MKGVGCDHDGKSMRDASVADLTFLPVLRRVLRRNVKSKATLESHGCQCPFGSDVRTSTCCKGIRTSEPGHWPWAVCPIDGETLTRLACLHKADRRCYHQHSEVSAVILVPMEAR